MESPFEDGNADASHPYHPKVGTPKSMIIPQFKQGKI